MTEDWYQQAVRWNPSQVRAPAGSAAGGQFAAGGSGSTPTAGKPVQQGGSGQQVKDLQTRLNALGAHLAVDGKFGPATAAAVKAFQKSHGLAVDGKVGPKTTAALRLKQHPAKTKHALHAAHLAHQDHVKAAKAHAAHEAHTAHEAHVAHEKHVAAGHKPATPKTAAPKATRALAHEKVGHTDQGLWHDPHRQLPAFIQHIANDLIQQRGMRESEAIATAVAQCKRWAAGGGDVKPDTQAKAAAAVAEWERLKAGAHAKRSTPMTTSSGYDEDGLDGSWDGPLDDLPSLTGLGVGDFQAVETAEARSGGR